MDISYHLRQIEKSIVEYNLFLEREYPELCQAEKETPTIVDKEYKMPFEMKVFQKRLKKHTFYRNRHKKVVQEDSSVVEFKSNEPTTENEYPDDISWSKLSKLLQKRALSKFIKSLHLCPEETRALIVHIWDAIMKKLLKTKHIQYEKREIKSICGLECREGTWGFDLSKVL